MNGAFVPSLPIRKRTSHFPVHISNERVFSDKIKIHEIEVRKKPKIPCGNPWIKIKKFKYFKREACLSFNILPFFQILS